nr:unnamed protein product [Haemonchus contortus]
MNISCASVPRSNRHHHQQPAALFGSSGSASAPPTPRSRQEGSRRPARRPISFTSKSNGSPCYAGSKFSDSPTARSIPLPPTEWIYEAYSANSETNSISSGSIGVPSDMETSSICSSAPSLSDVGELLWLHHKAFQRIVWHGHLLLRYLFDVQYQ